MVRLCFGARTQVLVAKCSSCIALSVLQHVKHFKALYSVCSVKTKNNANMSRKHWLNYLHQRDHRCKRRLMHEYDALARNVYHTTLYAQLIVTCNGHNIRMCGNTDDTAMMAISYYKCLIHCGNSLRLCLGARTQVLVAKCSPCIVLSVVLQVEPNKALYSVCSVKTKTNANMSRNRWLNYLHRRDHRCKRLLMHEIDEFA